MWMDITELVILLLVPDARSSSMVDSKFKQWYHIERISSYPNCTIVLDCVPLIFRIITIFEHHKAYLKLYGGTIYVHGNHMTSQVVLGTIDVDMACLGGGVAYVPGLARLVRSVSAPSATKSLTSYRCVAQ